QVITVLPPALQLLKIDSSFGPQETATGVRQSHQVQLPTAVPLGGPPVSVNITSSDAARVGLALCNATSSQNPTCTATTATGAGITVSILPGATSGYFDLVGLTTVSPDV